MSGQLYVLSFAPLVFIYYEAEWIPKQVVSWRREEMIDLK
jgi:hypothetical protein